MKKNSAPMLYHAIGDIPDDMIHEAHSEPPKRKRRLVMLIAASLAILLLIPTALLFSHMTSPAYRYRNHPYYALISSFLKKSEQDRLLAELDRDSFFELLSDALNFGVTKDEVQVSNRDDGAEITVSAPTLDNPFEITDNQVEGVLEADIIKRTKDRIYYLYGNVLTVYSIAGENSEPLGSLMISEQDGLSQFSATNLYLLGERIIIEGVEYEKTADGDYSPYTALISLSCEALEGEKKPQFDKLSVEGGLLSTRLTADSLLIMTAIRQYGEVDLESESFLPQYEENGSVIAMAPDKISVSELPSGAEYTAVYLCDLETLKVKDSHALLGTPQAQYVSGGTVYLSSVQNVLAMDEKGDPVRFEGTSGKYLNEITTSYVEGIRYTKDGFEVLGGVTLEGRIKDQYSMDEYEGVLRVAVTNVERHHCLTSFGNRIDGQLTETNASLYLVSGDTFEVISSALKFAPEGESVQSVRFDDTLAYICTALIATMTDPVYRFDLSDPRRISSVDTGTIEGYSTSLITMKNGDLLGIGYGEDRTVLKLEVYRKNGAALESVALYEEDHCYFPEDYKCYYINREAGYIGIALYDTADERDGETYYGQKTVYRLFSYDGETLTVLKDVMIAEREYGLREIRGFVDGDYLYVLSDMRLLVKPLGEDVITE